MLERIDLFELFCHEHPAMKLELHASTQMTLSSPDGLEFAAGFLDLKQAVLARYPPVISAWRLPYR